MHQPYAFVSAFDCDILRSAFMKSIIEKNIPQDKRRAEAELLLRLYTDIDDIDPDLLEWIVTGRIEVVDPEMIDSLLGLKPKPRSVDKDKRDRAHRESRKIINEERASGN